MTPTDLALLTELVARLRAPDGCPWDREQTLRDLRAYLLEEAHETADAIDRVGGDRVAGDRVAGDRVVGDRGALEDLGGELGDLLFQAAFIGALSEEGGGPGVGEAIARVHRKMVARHPHVFGEAVAKDAEAVRQAWERRKLAEKREGSLLDGVAASLPALTAAYRMTQKAAGVGFDWPDAGAVLAKLEEELGELRHSLAEGDRTAQSEELGDLLFTIANLARKLDLDPEAALAQTNLKFRRRFAAVEAGLTAKGRQLGEASLAEMDALWEEAKRGERG